MHNRYLILKHFQSLYFYLGCELYSPVSKEIFVIIICEVLMRQF